ncbi:MAG: RICIN domain-containing protein [Lachnospiraceae bacterium]|nr:RICIN domain-containing protein [Lachnospiraceae bacterium]
MKRTKLISFCLVLAIAVVPLSDGFAKYRNHYALAASTPVQESTYYNITNVCTGRMLDIPSGKDEDKNPLHTWTINNKDAEKFSFEKVAGEDYYYIVPKVAPTRVIDNPSSSMSAGTQYQIYTKNSTDAQRFKLEPDGEGNFKIINKKSGMALTDMCNEKGSTDEEKDITVRQQAVSSDSRQLWKITKLANDYYFNQPAKTDGADPSMVLAGGKYYYCYAGSGNTVKIAELSSLENMGSFGTTVVAFTPPDSGMYSKEVWAPELVWLSGRWYVYFCADDGTNANHRMYVLQGGTNADNPLDGDWTFMGKIYDTSNDRWAIDGTAFTYNNENYFVWSGWGDSTGGNVQNLYIAKMSNPWTLSTQRVCICQPTNSWEKSGGSSIAEGPEVLVNGSKVHIIYSAAASFTDSYCLGRITCTDSNLLNPSSWTKSDGPVFKGTEYTFAPGHNTFVKSVDGTENWIIYHCARYSGSKWTRAIRAQRFTWTDNGYPFFGEPIDQGVSVSRPSKTYTPPVNTTSYYKIVNVGTGKVMDIPNKSDANGTKIQTYADNNTIAQRFRFKSNSDKWFNIIPKCAESKVFDDPSGSKERNVSYQLYTSNGSPSQKFRFEYMGEGKYRIVNKASLLALTDTTEIVGGSGYVEQKRYMNSDYQLWQLVQVSSDEVFEDPTNVQVSSDDTWINLGAWSYYFGSWNGSNGTYIGGTTADKLTLNITANNKAQWGIQVALDNQPVISGHEYRYTIKVNSTSAGSIISKEDVSRLKEDTTNISSGDNTITGTFTATDSRAKILFELASGINAGTTLKFTNFSLVDLSAAVETTVAPTTEAPTEAPTTEAPTTEAPTEAPTTKPQNDIAVDEDGINTSEKVSVLGFQISTIFGGTRVSAQVEPTINGKNVVKTGMVFGLSSYDDINSNISSADMYVRTDNEFIKAYDSTTNGISRYKLGQSDTATYFKMTMSYGAANKTAYEAMYKVRAYAVLEDGTYVYSKTRDFSVFKIAKKLYNDVLMNTEESHNYLYNTILKTVDPDFASVEYKWGDTILHPYN